jgi:hypothetical protein
MATKYFHKEANRTRSPDVIAILCPGKGLSFFELSTCSLLRAVGVPKYKAQSERHCWNNFT